jgi:hypothetical protein
MLELRITTSNTLDLYYYFCPHFFNPTIKNLLLDLILDLKAGTV